MNGKFFVDNHGEKVFEGEYSESEILNKQFYGKPFPQLYQNHTNCIEETENMVSLIKKIRNILNIEKTDDYNEEIQKAEKRIGIEFPDCLKKFYSAKGKNTGLITSVQVTALKKEYYFEPQEIYTENNILVFSSTGKRKKSYLGIDLKENHLMIKEKDSEWEYEECLESFCELMSEKAVISAINMMPLNERFKIKGKELSELSPVPALENKFSGLWHKFEGYYNRNNSILLNEERKSVAWLRAGCNYGDIMIGSADDEIIRQFKKINL